MWLTGVLVSILVLVKPSTADLGLPMPILDLQSKVHSLIDNSRTSGEMFNKTLQELDTIPAENLGYHYRHVRQEWRGAMVDLARIHNDTLTNVTKAIDDRTSGHRKVFDELYSGVKNFKQQLVENRWYVDSIYELKAGLSNMQSLNETRNLLETGLESLWSALKVLDEVISKQQGVKSLTEEVVKKVVTPGMPQAVWSAVERIVGSMKTLNTLVKDLLMPSKLASQEADEFHSKLKKMFDWKDLKTMVNATKTAATKTVKTIAALTQKLNQTIFTAYKPLVKNKLIQDASAIDDFLENINGTLLSINEAVSDEANSASARVEDSINWFEYGLLLQIDESLDSVAEEIFTHGNYSLEESCAHKFPLLNATLSKVFQLMESCIWKQLKYFPNTAKTIEEFLQSLSATAMAPLADFQTCTASKLDRSLCLKSFVTTHQLQSDGSTGKKAIYHLMMPVIEVTMREFGEIYNRMNSCVAKNLAVPILSDLQRKREACYTAKSP